jgi:hypothetical protein
VSREYENHELSIPLVTKKKSTIKKLHIEHCKEKLLKDLVERKIVKKLVPELLTKIKELKYEKQFNHKLQ